LEDRRISAKSIAEQLGWVHHEDLNMRKLSAKWAPKCLNADQKRQRCQSSEQNLEFFRRHPNDFMSRLVTMDETWLYHYDPETKQESMEWRHSSSHHPKKFRAQKSAGNVLASIFFWGGGIKTVSSSLIIFQRAKLATRSITRSAGAIGGHFEGKTPREGHQGCFVRAQQCPGSPGTCNRKETGLPGLLVSSSPTLFSGSGPVGLPPVPWTERATERSPFLVRRGGHCYRGEWLAKVRAMG